MKKIWAILILFMLAGCTVPEVPENAQVTITVVGDITDLRVYEDGYHCWHTNPQVQVMQQVGNRVYYGNMPEGNYCACWLDVPPDEFDFTLNGEPAVGIIHHCKLFSLPGNVAFSIGD